MRAILTYHSIDSSGSPISVDPETFRRQVRWLAAGWVQVVSIDELMELPPEIDAVSITFDDGFENYRDVAAPVLEDHGMPATVFVVTDRVGTTNNWSGTSQRGIPTLRLMDWESIGEVAGRGTLLGVHSRTHCRLTTVSGSQLVDEIAGAAARLAAETGVMPTTFAYPYGSFNVAAADEVRAAFRWACTTELRALGRREQAHLLPRLDMYYFRAPGRLEAWGTASLRRFIALRSRARRVREQLATITALTGLH
jgi:peptidoglycan/xylan/chitin deacetylase (PgdA/CDA1 family)